MKGNNKMKHYGITSAPDNYINLGTGNYNIKNGGVVYKSYSTDDGISWYFIPPQTEINLYNIALLIEETGNDSLLKATQFPDNTRLFQQI